VADTDTDGDGSADCIESCDTDPAKTAPGICGCGVADTDTDGDGSADCIESCDTDPAKTAPGICGCGTPDTDTDGDGSADCIETCDNDPAKTAPGQCGCGTPDTDTDGDGIANCVDACPLDPNNDVDGDGVCGNVDNCPNDANADQADLDNDGIGNVCDTNDQTGSLVLSNVSISSADPMTNAPGRARAGALVVDSLGGGLGDDLALGNVYFTLVAGPFSANMPVGTCTTTNGGRVKCRNDAAGVKAIFYKVIQGDNVFPDIWKMIVKQKQIATTAIPAGPVTLTLVQPTPSISRGDDIAACVSKSGRLRCREH
jgi:hypothetical protein